MLRSFPSKKTWFSPWSGTSMWWRRPASLKGSPGRGQTRRIAEAGSATPRVVLDPSPLTSTPWVRRPGRLCARRRPPYAVGHHLPSSRALSAPPLPGACHESARRSRPRLGGLLVRYACWLLALASGKSSPYSSSTTTAARTDSAIRRASLATAWAAFETCRAAPPYTWKYLTT